MSDEPQTPSPDGSDAPFPELSERDLDDVLAQAGLLADQLSVELGRTDIAFGEPASTRVSEQRDVTTPLDDELAQLDRLVTTASDEVGDVPIAPLPPATPEPRSDRPAPEHPATHWDGSAEAEFKNLFPGGKLPPPPPLEVVQQAMTPPEHLNMPTSLTHPQLLTPASNPTGESPQVQAPPAQTAEDGSADEDRGDDDIPDFMREFMEPEVRHETPDEATGAPTAANTEPVFEATPLPVQMKPGVVGTGMVHKVVRQPPAQGTEPELEPSVDVMALPKAGTLRARLLVLLRLLKRIPSPVPALGRIAYVVCSKGVTLLERIDKPTQRLGYRVRTLIGWVAMATLGTSVVVYLISLL